MSEVVAVTESDSGLLTENTTHLVGRRNRQEPGEDAAGRRRAMLRVLARWRAKTTSQQELAARMGTTQPSLARLEQGRVDPKLSTLEKYAAAMGGRFVWYIVDEEGRVADQDFFEGTEPITDAP